MCKRFKPHLQIRHALYIALVTLFFTIFFAFVTSTPAHSSPALSAFVDPMIGTADGGNTQPGPVVPFGMISWGPNTLADNDESITDKYLRDVGYQYGSKDHAHRLSGFTLTHLAGAGCANGGELPFLPFAGTPISVQYPAVTFNHKNESASAGYYQVTLDSGVKVELTSTLRTGFARFTFPSLKKDAPYGVQFFHSKRANPPDAGEVTHPSDFQFQDDQHFTGSVEGGDFCASTNKYRLYFAGEISQAGGTTHVDANEARLTFGVSNGVTSASANIDMRIAISYVSVEGALKNLEAGTFESVHQAAAAEWDQALSKITVTPLENRTFYTALYHSLLYPSVQDDVTGEYMGYDDQVHTVPAGHHFYANFSGWDIYRSEAQLLALLFPTRASDMAQSLVYAAEQCGGIPQWAVNHSDTAVMLGDPGPIILADFYAFGAQAFDQKSAFRFMKKNATDPLSTCNGHLSRPGLEAYQRLGYVPHHGVEFGATSTTLEYAMADFAISRYALAQGQNDFAAQMLNRSQSWKNSWSNEGYIRGKTDQGEWLTPFFPDRNPTMRDPYDPDPNSIYDQGFVEGSSIQYSFMIPFDFAEVLSRIGSANVVQERLDHYFTELNTPVSPYLWIGNEPSFSTPWIYLWAGRPSGTQLVLDRIVTTLFSDKPGGLPGNDDLGAMSSWYVFSALGFYPAIPGEGDLMFHSPHFANAKITLENGRVITLQGSGVGPYVRGLKLNDQDYSQTWIQWSQLQNGADLKFDLAPVPSAWGTSPAAAPPSFHSNLRSHLE